MVLKNSKKNLKGFPVFLKMLYSKYVYLNSKFGEMNGS